MFDHISIGVRDIAKAKTFYDAALKPLGYTCFSADESSLGYGKEGVGFWILAAERPVPTTRSPASTSFTAPSQAERVRVPQGGDRDGGRDNGKPGVRKDYGPDYYAAFVFDPDGYRLEAYHGGK